MIFFHCIYESIPKCLQIDHSQLNIFIHQARYLRKFVMSELAKLKRCATISILRERLNHTLSEAELLSVEGDDRRKGQ